MASTPNTPPVPPDPPGGHGAPGHGAHAPPTGDGSPAPVSAPTATGTAPAAGPPAPPPDPDRDPPRWPGWYAPVAFVLAVTLIAVGGAILGAVVAAGGGDPGESSPGFNVVATFIQDAAFVLAALLLAAQALPPRPWHFGLRRARLWPAVGWTVVAFLAFITFQGIYNVLLQPDERQDVAETLGVDQGTGWLVLGVVVVVMLAPVAEEFFFRGFFYRAARNGLVPRLGERGGMLAAAAVSGAVFGVIHISPAVAIPPLAVFGFILCLLYERTGSLYAPIALHAVNNTFAFSLLAKDSLAVTLPAGAAMLVACAILPRVLPGHAPRPGAVAA